MVQIPSQPHVYRRPDLPAFDGLPMIDRAFCSALRVARTLGDDYATEGMDLEEVGLAHTMENLLYTIPQKCEAALGEHPTDVASCGYNFLHRMHGKGVNCDTELLRRIRHFFDG